jgi:CelD/BcsL family acetyltransferase involved in cellulose biosynthesis
MLSVKEINNQSGFSSLEEDWTALLKKSRSDTVFLTWEWMYTWWECFQKNLDLFILTVYDENNNLVGIAPLCIDKKRICGIPVLNYIKFLGTMPTSSDHLDFIIFHGMEREALISITDYMFHIKTWDLCLLSNIPISSLTAKLLKKIIENKPFQSEVSQICPYISLPTRIEYFHSSISKKMRNMIKRERRNLYNKYKDVDFVIWKIPESIDDAMEKLFRLHKSRWMAVKHKGNFIDSNIRKFHKKVARAFLNSDMLRLYFLRVQGKDVAALYTFKYNNKLCYYQSGRDPEWSKEGVGGILINLIIENAIKKGYAEFDFLRGMEDYKTRLTDKKREEIDIFITNSLNARIFLLFRNLYHRMKR